MSRAAFEKWQQKRFPLNEDDLNSDFIENALHEAWLAGRESMRDEAVKVCELIELGADTSWRLNYDPEDQGRSNGACECAFDIRKIAP